MKNEYLTMKIQEIERGAQSQNLERVQIGIEELLKYSRQYRNFPEIKIDLDLVGTPKTRYLYSLYTLLKNLNEENFERIWVEGFNFFDISLTQLDFDHLEKKLKIYESIDTFKKKRTIKLLSIFIGIELEKKHKFGGYGKKFYKNLAEIIINDFKDPEIICEILKNEKSIKANLNGYRRELK